MSSQALCVAAKAGFVERVEALLDASALVTVTDKRGYTPLMCAAENPSVVESAILLIAYGADIHYTSVRGAVGSRGGLHACLRPLVLPVRHHPLEALSPLPLRCSPTQD